MSVKLSGYLGSSDKPDNVVMKSTVESPEAREDGFGCVYVNSHNI